MRGGDTLKIMVSTNPVSKFSLEIYRTGYYGGTGGRLVKQFDSLKGKTQPDPPIGENRLRECQWEPSVEFTIPNGGSVASISANSRRKRRACKATSFSSCAMIVWNSSFNVEGASKEEAEELARVIYQGCYDGITRVLTAK